MSKGSGRGQAQRALVRAASFGALVSLAVATTAGAAPASTSQNPPSTKIKVAIIAVEAAAQVMYAKDRGFFRKQGIDAEMGHSEWLPGSASILSIAKEAPGRHVIFTVPASGGRATIVHRVQSEHDFSGLGVSSDGRLVAFAGPAPDGYFQIFLKTLGKKGKRRLLGMMRGMR